jgi:hypothetical protein
MVNIHEKWINVIESVGNKKKSLMCIAFELGGFSYAHQMQILRIFFYSFQIESFD